MCNVWAVDEEHNKKATIQVDKPDLNHIPINEFESIVFFSYVWDKIYSTEMIREYNIRFNELISYGEDYEFNCDYIKYCDEGIGIPEPLCVAFDS